MLTIYSIPESLYCAKTRILLRHKGLAFEELAPPGGYGSDAYKEIVPSGNLPAMIDGDLLLTDSEAIAEYLDERHPEPAMLPGDIAGRALMRQHSRYHDTRLEPAVRMLFPLMRPARRTPDAVAAALAKIRTRLAQLAPGLAELRGAACRDASARALMLGDCGYPVTFRWIEALSRALGNPITFPPAITDYDAALTAHPAVADEFATYRPAMAAWIARVTNPA